MKKLLRIIVTFAVVLCISLSFFAILNSKKVYAEETSMQSFYSFQQQIKNLSLQDEILLSKSSASNGDMGLSEENSNAETQESIFKFKRLIVNDVNFNTYGAIKDISGYKNYHILCYASILDTVTAYQNLLADGVNVAIDEEVKAESYYDQTYSYTSYNSWGVEKIDIGGYRQYLTDTNATNEVVVVVLDTGINTSHEMFSDRFLYENGKIVGESYYTSTYTYSGYNFEDGHSHGTHVSGTIAELTPSNVKIIPMKVLSDGGSGSRSYIVAAMAMVAEVYSAKYNIACINMSLGGGYDSSSYNSYTEVIDDLYNKNILTVVAAGNDAGEASEHLPAACENAITVSSLKTDTYGATFDFSYSNYGSVVDVAAPGTSIKSAVIASSNGAAPTAYGTKSGTSMATPHVAGVVALLCCDGKYYSSGTPNYTASQIEARLKENLIDAGAPGKDDYYGYGILNLRHFETTETSSSVIFKNGSNIITPNESWVEFSGSLNLSISCSDASYSMYYTLDYTLPTAKKDTLFSSSLNISKSVTITAVGYKTSGGTVYRTDVVTLKLFHSDGDMSEYFTISSSGQLTNYTGHFRELTIPQTINGITVKSLGGYLFEYTEIESLTLPSACNSIGSYAFRYCSSLNYIYGPSVVSIGSYAFFECSSLTTLSNDTPASSTGLYFPTVTSLGAFSFYYSSITSVDLTSLSSLGRGSFANAENLTSAKLPNVTTIPYASFWKTKLNTFHFGKKVTSVGDSAFLRVPLKTLTIDSNNTAIYCDGNGVYSGGALVAFTIGTNVTTYEIRSSYTSQGTQTSVITIYPYALEYATIGTLTIPSTIVHMNTYCISDATINKLIYKADSVVSTSYYNSSYEMYVPPFYGTNITWLEIDAGVSKIPTYLFRSAIIKNITINSSSTILEASSFYLYGTTSTVGAVYLEDSSLDSNWVSYFTSSQLSSYTSTIFSKAEITTAISGFSAKGTSGDYYVYSRYSGTVTTYTVTVSASAGGTVSPSGTSKVYKGASFKVSFSPNTSYHVSSILIDGSALSSTELQNAKNNGYYQFSSITADRTIHINFAKSDYSITASAGTGGSISPSGTSYFSNGDNVTYTFTANPDYKVDSIIVDGTSLTGSDLTYAINNGYTFSNISSSHTISVTFRVDGYIIKATAGAGGSVSPSGSVVVKEGYSKLFAFTPNEGYEVATIIVDGSALSGTAFTNAVNNGYIFSNVTSDHTISVTFKKLTYKITAIVTGSGSVSPSGITAVEYGSTLTMTLTPTLGSSITNILVDDQSVPIGDLDYAITYGKYVFDNITASHTIEVIFAVGTYTISSSVNGSGGTISPSGTVSVTGGTDVTFSITPNLGYEIYRVVIDEFDVTGESFYNITSTNSYTFEFVSASHTILVEFKVKSYTITASSNGYGTIYAQVNGGTTKVASLNGETVTHGGVIAYTLVPNAGYSTLSISIDGNLLEGEEFDYAVANGLYFDYVNGNHTVYITFGVKTYTILAVADSGGSISPDGEIAYSFGESATYTFAPDAGYYVSKIFVDSAELGTSELASAIANGYSFENISNNHIIIVFFEQNLYTITASVNGSGGTISPSGTISCSYGDSLTFTIKPNTGYYLSSLKVDQADLSAEQLNSAVLNGYTFSNISESHIIVASFTKDIYTITANSSENGSVVLNGTVINTPHINQVEYSSFSTYTFVPNSGYYVSSIAVDGVNLVGTALQEAITSGYTFKNVTKSHKIEVTFSSYAYSITTSVNNTAYGYITPYGVSNYSYGEEATFTLSLNNGCYVSSIIIDGENLNENQITLFIQNGYTFENISQSHYILVELNIYKYQIEVSATAGGSVSPLGESTVIYGDSLTINISKNSGYVIKQILVDQVALSASQVAQVQSNGYYTFNNVTSSHSIYVEFEIETYSVTIIVGDNGKASYNGIDITNNTVTVNLDYGDSLTVEFTPFTGYFVKEIVIDGNKLAGTNLQYALLYGYLFDSIKTSHTAVVEFEMYTYTITAISGENGSISPNATTTLNYGESLTYTFIASHGYHVSQILIDGESLEEQGLYNAIENGYTFNYVIQNHTIAVYFAINTYTITATAGDNGTITPSGEKGVEDGDSVTYTFTPNTGYYVKGIVVDGQSLSQSEVEDAIYNGYTFENITSSHTILVEFAIYVFIIEITAGANGSITYGNDAIMGDTTTINVNYGQNITFAFVPQTGYQVQEIIVDGTTLGIADKQSAIQNGYMFGLIKGSHTLSVSFEATKYCIKASANEYGTVLANGEAISIVGEIVVYGESITYTFMPNQHYYVAEIKVDGTALLKTELSLAVQNGYTFSNVTCDHTISVTFAMQKYTVTASASAGGLITPVGEIQVNSGDSQTFTFMPLQGYYITSIIVDGTPLTGNALINSVNGGSYIFNSVQKDHTIAITFAIYTYMVTTTQSANGSISPSEQTAVNYGGNVYLTFNPNTGYHLQSITVNGQEITENIDDIERNGYIISFVTENYNISATFARNFYIISFRTDGKGTLTLVNADAQSVEHGSSVTVKIMPEDGWWVKEVTVNGTSIAVEDNIFTIASVEQNVSVFVLFETNAPVGVNPLIIAIVIGIAIIVIALIPTLSRTFKGRKEYISTPISTGDNINNNTNAKPIKTQLEKNSYAKSQNIKSEKLDTEDILKTIQSVQNNSSVKQNSLNGEKTEENIGENNTKVPKKPTKKTPPKLPPKP